MKNVTQVRSVACLEAYLASLWFILYYDSRSQDIWDTYVGIYSS